jgi:hypothetical protein
MTAVSCSWCDRLNAATARTCRGCGHNPTVARLECDCATCTTARQTLQPVKQEHVRCSRCGTRCSGHDPELGLVVRAYVQCVTCLESDEAGGACINCHDAFQPNDTRHYYGTHDVGPFCAACDRAIKIHTKFLPEAN